MPQCHNFTHHTDSGAAMYINCTTQWTRQTGYTTHLTEKTRIDSQSVADVTLHAMQYIHRFIQQ